MTLVDRLEQLHAEATRPPWWNDYGKIAFAQSGMGEMDLSADAALIVELRNALPALLTALRAAYELSEAEWPPHIETRIALEDALVPLFGEDTTP